MSAVQEKTLNLITHFQFRQTKNWKTANFGSTKTKGARVGSYEKATNFGFVPESDCLW